MSGAWLSARAKTKTNYLKASLSRVGRLTIKNPNKSLGFFMVEHIGFEPMTSSMPWKRASQLRQCPSSEYDLIVRLLKAGFTFWSIPPLAILNSRSEQVDSLV